jgi:hypothetical protein
VQLSQINEIWCYSAGGGNAPSACRLLHFHRSANHQNGQEHTIVPIPSSQTALRTANDTRSGVQPRSDAARLLCPRLPSSISASLPSTSFVFRAFVIRQNSSSSYHSTIPTPHPGLSTISFASASLQYQDCGTTEHIDPIVAASCIILRDPFSQGSFCDLAISAPLYSSYTNIASYRHASSQVHPRRQARQDGAYSRREPGEVCFTVCSLQDSMLTPF